MRSAGFQRLEIDLATSPGVWVDVYTAERPLLSASTRWYFPAMWLRTEPFVPNMTPRRATRPTPAAPRAANSLTLGLTGWPWTGVAPSSRSTPAARPAGRRATSATGPLHRRVRGQPAGP